MMFCSAIFSLFSFIILISGSECAPKMRSSILDDVTNFFWEEKCMQELGCFGNAPPYFSFKERPISLVPQDRDIIGTTFHMYTPERRYTSLNFTNSNASVSSILEAGFRKSLRTVFIIHGFMAHLAPVWMEPMKDAILDVEDANVLIVTWPGGDGPFYEQAVANTRVVGAEVALLVQFLHKNLGLEPESVYLIGHSLGSHIAGYAGKRIPRLGRITGLDPAGPYFEDVDSSIRLNSTDALLVDIIHTDAATNRFQGFGTTESIGDLDFYVNGGSKQPGCPDMGSAILDFLMHPNLNGPEVVELMCHHHRAIELMISSIKNRDCPIIAAACDSWLDFLAGHCGTCDNDPSLQRNRDCTEMGYYADRYKTDMHVDLYVKTTEKTPYCTKRE